MLSKPSKSTAVSLFVRKNSRKSSLRMRTSKTMTAKSSTIALRPPASRSPVVGVCSKTYQIIRTSASTCSSSHSKSTRAARAASVESGMTETNVPPVHVDRFEGLSRSGRWVKVSHKSCLIPRPLEQKTGSGLVADSSINSCVSRSCQMPFSFICFSFLFLS